MVQKKKTTVSKANNSAPALSLSNAIRCDRHAVSIVFIVECKFGILAWELRQIPTKSELDYNIFVLFIELFSSAE